MKTTSAKAKAKAGKGRRRKVRPNMNDIGWLLDAGNELAESVLGVHGDPHGRAQDWREVAEQVTKRLSKPRPARPGKPTPARGKGGVR